MNIFSFIALVLSLFVAMREKLHLPRGQQMRLWLHHNRGANYFLHCHEELEINLVVRGHAAYLVKDQRYDLTSGSLLWLFPDQEHLLIEQSADFQMWVAVFRRPFVRSICSTHAAWLLSRDPASGFCSQLSPDTHHRLARLYADLDAALGDLPRLNSGAAYAILESLAAHQQAETHRPLRTVHPAVEQATRLLHSAPAAYTLTTLARQVQLSPSRLCRLFKRQMGLTLVSYRQRRALERFLDLFARSPQRKLMSLALQAGFGSYPQFHRVFRREMGRTPADFLRNPN